VRFSVLIPVYNAGPFLARAVQSALDQSCGDFELIVIDDGSTDGCRNPVRSLNDPRIRILSQTNQGAPAAINTGLRAANGERIALLDADDLWMPGKLAAHWECIASHPELDLTFDWSRWIDERDQDLGLSSRPWQGPISFEQLLVDFVPGNSSSLVFRRRAIDQAGGMNSDLAYVKDVDLCLRVARLRPGNCRSVPGYLTRYRRHSGQISRKWRDHQKDWERLLGQVTSFAPPGTADLLSLADSNMRRYVAWLAAEEGDGLNAVLLALSALFRAPFQAPADSRNWAVLAAACGRCLLPNPYYSKALNLGKRLFNRG